MFFGNEEKTPRIGVFEKFFIYFIVVSVSIVLINKSTGSFVKSTESIGISDNIEFNGLSDLLTEDKLSTVNKLALGITGLDDLTEFADPNWSSDAERLYYPIIIKHSKRYNVDPLLIKAVIMAESSFNPNAVSRAGAQGLMQLMPRTARALGVEDSFNPEHNIQGGVKYIKRLLNRFDGDVKLALAAYNAGSYNVRKYKGIPPYPETKNYVKKVSHLHSSYKKAEPVSGKGHLISQI